MSLKDINEDVTGVLASILGKEVSPQDYSTKAIVSIVLKWYHQGQVDEAIRKTQHKGKTK